MWTISDVGEWLISLSLSQYVEIFCQNEIAGPILLDISLEDLDYMGISILGHRKTLLKGIEDLRTNRRVTIALAAPAAAVDTNRRKELSSQSTDVRCLVAMSSANHLC